MKIITLDEHGLSDLSIKLIERVHRDGFVPTHIVGIATGGAEVAKRMMPGAPEGTKIAIIRCQRPTTRAKKIIPNTLKILPYFASNVLRRIESNLLNRFRPQEGFGARRVVDLSPGDLYEKDGEERRVLIVDDALDSGSTFVAVRTHLRGLLGPNSEIRLAAVSVTTRAPKLKPDWYIYDRTIVRFPWSLDYKGKDRYGHVIV